MSLVRHIFCCSFQTVGSRAPFFPSPYLTEEEIFQNYCASCDPDFRNIFVMHFFYIVLGTVHSLSFEISLKKRCRGGWLWSCLGCKSPILVSPRLFRIIVDRGEWLWNSTKFFVVCFCSLFWPWLPGGEGGYSGKFWIGVCREGCWTLTLFKD